MSKDKEQDKNKATKSEIARRVISEEIAMKQVEDYINNSNVKQNLFNDKLLFRYLESEAKKKLSPFSAVRDQVDEVIDSIIGQFSQDIFGNDEGLNAKEEDISASLSIKITNALVGKMESKLDGKTFGDYCFKIKTQKKQKQEAYTGADMVGLCTLDMGKNKINKYFLLQAKVGARRDDGSIIAKDDRIQEQARKMLNISPASFFIVYTLDGFEVVSAMNIQTTGKNEIDTHVVQGKSYQDFNNLILECFVGDNRFENEEWKNYVIDPKNNPIPYEEALLHIFVTKKKTI